MRYLTKSRFKLALECLTKLYYTKKSVYADISIDDPFLEALAEGGFQVGELAKFLFCDDPAGQKITIDTLDYNKSLEETAKRLENKSIVIAEAAFKFQSLFVRSDIIVNNANVFDLYEVKSKSTDGEDLDFITKRGEPKVTSSWIPYLYDVAFQKYVLMKSLSAQNVTVHAHLILVDKSKIASVEGLNQKFKILKTENGSKIELEPGLTKQKLGNSILKIQNIDDVIQKIWDELSVPTDYQENLKFEEFVDLCADIYSKDTRVYAPLGKKCKECQFVNHYPEVNKQKSGFHECWKNKTKYNDELLNKSLALDLWGGLMGNRSVVQELIDKGKYLLEQVSELDIAPKSQTKEYVGLSPLQRRLEQITRIKNKIKDSYFDKKGLKKEMESWIYPLHMIDFETSMPALPFHKGRHPYEGIAFQFSHHIVEKTGEVRHAGQFLSFEQGAYPNYEFIRALKSQLEIDEGTIFRYHNHENTYLNFIFNQLEEDSNPPKDAANLKAFIRNITNWKEEGSSRGEHKQGNRCMVDLYKLVLSYYYSPYARGSNSIKDILPAIIQDSDFLKSKYSNPIYGKLRQVQSLNFDEHVWINPKYDMDPYKTLPKLFEDYDTDQLDRFFGGFDELADGGAAMTAYNYLQFSHIPNDQREKLKEGLLRYCELDTLAMVMILEGWINY
jgi:hypothetical protein